MSFKTNKFKYYISERPDKHYSFDIYVTDIKGKYFYALDWIEKAEIYTMLRYCKRKLKVHLAKLDLNHPQ